MTNAEARFNNSLRPRKPEGSLGRTAQDVHLDSHTPSELLNYETDRLLPLYSLVENAVTSVFVENALERSHAVGVRPAVVTFNAGLYLRSG